MHGEDGLRENLVAGPDDGLQHPLVGVAACAFGNLNDKRGLGVNAAPKQAHRLLGVVDVVSADSILAVSMFEQCLGGDDHSRVDAPQKK